MAIRTTLAAILGLLLCISSPIPKAAVISFDDLDASAGDIDLAGISPYAGYTWTNVLAYTTTPGFPGFNNGIASGPNAAYSGGEYLGAFIEPVIGRVIGSSPFSFLSAAVGSGYYDGLVVTIQGFLGGNLLFSRNVTVGTSGATVFDFGFGNIDTLAFFASTNSNTTDPFQCGPTNCTQFTIDDLVFGPPITSVPEPGVLLLLAMGLFVAFLTTTTRCGRRD
jgi:hypothetical protein